MKKIAIEYIAKPGIRLLFFTMPLFSLKAQITDSATIRLSLKEAVWYAKGSNKLIGVLKTEERAARGDLDDARMGALPRFFTNASYQRYTRVTLYEDVLGDSRKITKPPNANGGSLNIEAAFNLYAGGRQQYVVNDVKRKGELAAINTREQEANIGLQVALQYLEMIRIYFQERLIKDQKARAQTRLKNIESFYANGKVTKSDLLRAEVLLSNVQLSETANRNDYLISNQRLNTLLDLNERTKIIPLDTASLHLPGNRELDTLLKSYPDAYAIIKAQKFIELQANRVALAKSTNMPTVALIAGYGFNYPNTLVFPPVAQTFAVGLVGVRVSYDISSLYQNKNKIKSACIREAALRQQKDYIEDNVQQEVSALAIKYDEAVKRMQVVKKNIEQAEINYNIQNTKYLNQLSLLTDLLEADNLYQESRYNYIQANVAALSIYYRLLFITGKL